MKNPDYKFIGKLQQLVEDQINPLPHKIESVGFDFETYNLNMSGAYQPFKDNHVDWVFREEYNNLMTMEQFRAIEQRNHQPIVKKLKPPIKLRTLIKRNIKKRGYSFLNPNYTNQ